MAEQDISLLQHLDTPQLTCLNENPQHTLKSIVASKTKNTGSAYVLSDADEQLLLNIPFNQTVKIRSIAIQSSNIPQAPKKIRLLTNRPSLNFEDVEDEHSVLQEIDLSEDDVREGKRIDLRFVRFQSVTSLHIFVVSNQGGEDETRIDAIDIFGMPVMGTRDVSGLRKVEDE
ncbi:PITH domain-containing protein [Dichomitus squalens]|uniref:PITH domain-containing protein n=1 Tax=Dichomitus squalens TaxID=114155 RepID=A0A4Q9P6R5_9APHY|nr:PITH domain-containing protein [Dichomitus squalens]TBU66210.1 PITH domain-containing protein [Dichomitus squalens]